MRSSCHAVSLPSRARHDDTTYASVPNPPSQPALPRQSWMQRRRALPWTVAQPSRLHVATTVAHVRRHVAETGTGHTHTTTAIVADRIRHGRGDVTSRRGVIP